MPQNGPNKFLLLKPVNYRHLLIQKHFFLFLPTCCAAYCGKNVLGQRLCTGSNSQIWKYNILNRLQFCNLQCWLVSTTLILATHSAAPGVSHDRTSTSDIYWTQLELEVNGHNGWYLNTLWEWSIYCLPIPPYHHNYSHRPNCDNWAYPSKVCFQILQTVSIEQMTIPACWN